LDGGLAHLCPLTLGDNYSEEQQYGGEERDQYTNGGNQQTGSGGEEIKPILPISFSMDWSGFAVISILRFLAYLGCFFAGVWLIKSVRGLIL
jgi:hypothetical protein